MIAHLQGRIFEKQPNRVIVDVQGVGYDVSVPLSTFYGLGNVGSDVALRIHTHVREDVIALYGFATRLELDLFDRLIGVSGIGPKLALAVLSGIEPDELIRAIEQTDVARLTSIPGVGKKTSERIVLELKDRLPKAPPSESPRPAPKTTRSTRPDSGLGRSTTTSARTGCARTSRCQSRRHGSVATRSITCSSTGRPAWARRRWPT